MNSTRVGVLSLFALVLVAAVALFLWQPWRETPASSLGVGEDTPAHATPAPAPSVARDALPQSRAAAPEAPAGRDAGPAAARADLDQSRYVITGRIVDDTGTAIPSVEVAATPPRFPGAKSTEERKVQSGADGRFTLADVPGGLVNLALRSEVWAAERSPVLLHLEGRKNPDPVEFSVVKAAQVRGVVTEAGGAPIAGATVIVEPRRAGGLAQGLPLERFGAAAGAELPKTDSKGEFAVKGLFPGAFVLRVRQAGFMTAEQTLELARGETRGDLVIALHRGLAFQGRVVDDLGRPIAGAEVFPRRTKTIGQDFAMIVDSTERHAATRTDVSGSFELAGMGPEAVDLVATHEAHQRGELSQVKPGSSEVVLRLVRNGAIEGRVVDRSGNPVAGAKVAVERQGSGAFLIRPGERDVPVDPATGAYRLNNVPPGKAVVVAEVPGRGEVESAPVEVLPGETIKGVDVLVRSGATLAATVHDPAGQPLAGALVEVRGKGPDEIFIAGTGGDHTASYRSRRVRGPGRGELPPELLTSKVLASGHTEADGTVRLSGLEPGDVQVVATHKDFAAAAPATVTLAAEATAERTLRVRAGGSIEGLCAGSDGAALPGEDVVVFGPTEDGEGARDQELQSGQDGTFRTGRLAPGTYEVKFKSLNSRSGVVADGPQVLIAGMERKKSPFAVESLVAEGTVSRVTLRKPAMVTLTGTVRDADGVVAGAEVTLRGADELDLDMIMGSNAKRARTKKTGVYALADLVPGTYVLRWRRSTGGLSSETEIQLAENAGTVTRDLVLPGGSVSGRVTGIGNQPLAGATVTAEPAAARSPGQPQRRQQGVMITMSLNAEGNDESSVTSATSGRRTSVKTAEDGTFTLREIPDGQYELKVTHEKHADATKSGVQVSGNASVAAGDINMGPGAVIEGELRDAEGKPVRMGMVTLRTEGETQPRTAFARNGRFSFTGLRAGKYTVSGSPMGAGGESRNEPVQVTLGEGKTEKVTVQAQ